MAKIFLASLLIVALACTESKNKPDYPIVARIMSSLNGDYQVREVTIASLSDLDSMSGSVGSIKGQAALNVDADIEEIMASADPTAVYSDRGRTVHTDYIVQKSVVIPQNFQTMEMLGLYYSYERTFQFWTENFDIPIAAIGLPNLYYNPQLISNKNGEQIEVSNTMNAAYLPSVRDFWFFKTASRERVQVKMNFGVIAHEFGHFVFDYLFAELDQNNYSARLRINEYFLSGVNEGFADFFSFMVTGSVIEFAASLPELDAQRRLPVAWTLSSVRTKGCLGSFYCEGSVLASALYEIALALDPTGLAITKLIIRALPQFREDWLLHRDNDLIDYSILLNAIIDQSGADRATYCRVFQKWFDTDSVRLNLTCS